MEEKERFELFGEYCIKDNNPDARPQLFDACVACVILNEQYKHIKDLEAKLAESEKQIKDARELGIEQFHSLKEIINFSQEEIDKFKQQLDEKEQENERLKEEICRYEITLMDKNSQLKKQNQDKISFAIAELEKVKDYAQHIQGGLINYIDNQIEEPKKEMK